MHFKKFLNPIKNDAFFLTGKKIRVWKDKEPIKKRFKDRIDQCYVSLKGMWLIHKMPVLKDLPHKNDIHDSVRRMADLEKKAMDEKIRKHLVKVRARLENKYMSKSLLQKRLNDDSKLKP